MSSNGNDEKQAKLDAFKIEQSSLGVIHAYMEIAERVMNGHVDHKQAQEGTRALNGASTFVKTQIEAIKMIDKGSSPRVREAAAGLLGLSGGPKLEDHSNAKKPDHT